MLLNEPAHSTDIPLCCIMGELCVLQKIQLLYPQPGEESSIGQLCLLRNEKDNIDSSCYWLMFSNLYCLTQQLTTLFMESTVMVFKHCPNFCHLFPLV